VGISQAVAERLRLDGRVRDLLTTATSVTSSKNVKRTQSLLPHPCIVSACKAVLYHTIVEDAGSAQLGAEQKVAWMLLADLFEMVGSSINSLSTAELKKMALLLKALARISSDAGLKNFSSAVIKVDGNLAQAMVAVLKMADCNNDVIKCLLAEDCKKAALKILVAMVSAGEDRLKKQVFTADYAVGVLTEMAKEDGSEFSADAQAVLQGLGVWYLVKV
jgi:hypothetical protein